MIKHFTFASPHPLLYDSMSLRREGWRLFAHVYHHRFPVLKRLTLREPSERCKRQNLISPLVSSLGSGRHRTEATRKAVAKRSRRGVARQIPFESVS